MTALSENREAVRLASLGQHEAALAAYDRALALDPDFAEAWSNRGNSLFLSGQIDAALQSHAQALAIAPSYGAAWFNRAHILLLRESWAEAVAHYDAGLALLGDQPGQLTNRGNALLRLGQTEAALASFQRATALMPDLVEAHNGIAAALVELGHFTAALAASDIVMALRPDWAEGLGTRGAALSGLGRFTEGLACQDRALAIQPDNPVLHFNRAVALQDLRDIRGLEAYDRAIALRPEHADAHWNRALFQLALGDFTGWAGHEWGWAAGHRGLRRFGPPARDTLWLGGEPIQGRRLLLHAEQGMGDTLQFIRYALLAQAAGAEVVVEVQPPLVRLLQRLPGLTVIAQGADVPAFDLHCPLMSLPLAFATQPETIPAPIPYLRAAPSQLGAKWRAEASELHCPLVGLVWAGAPRPEQPAAHCTDQRRSLHVTQLAPLAGAHASFVSLQKGEAGQQAKPFAMRDPTAELHDFADTADLVAELDLVISVDTSVAHLAAALGRPVWLLSRHDACWRWGFERTDTPWYPTMRLFRQPKRGDWGSVLADVAEALTLFSPTPSASAANR